MSNPCRDVYAFGCYRLDPASRLLTRSGERVSLPPKTFDLLVILAGSGGRLLTRHELITSLWPDAFVEEGNLTFQISSLRKALGEDDWIESVPKHGYRFRAPIKTENGALPSVPAEKPSRPHRASMAWATAAIVVIAAAALGYQTYRGWSSEAADSGSTIRPGAIYQPIRITSYSGFEEWPDLSPDGSQVAFAWDGPLGGNYSIYLKLAGPGEPLRLTDAPGRDVSPAWSPDGRWIAFARFAPAKGPIRILGPERVGIYVKPALGGAERRVHEIWSSFPKVEFPRKILAWTPDGNYIAAGEGSEPRMADPGRGLWLLPVSGGEPSRLTAVPSGFQRDTSPAFSPDGHCLAFARSAGTRGDVYAVRLRDNMPMGEPQRITAESGTIGSMAWTFDASAIIYSFGVHTGYRGLRRVAVTADCGAASREVSLPYGEQATTFGLSRTGKVVYAKGDRAASLWKWDISGSSDPRQIFGTTQDDHTPAYSPDGRRIAFASTRSGTEEIWLSNPDGSNPLQLTSMNGPTTANPRFSPDGRTILFNSRKEGKSDLYLLELSTGGLKRLTSYPEEEIQAEWSRSGKFIYFASDSSTPGFWQINRIAADGGAPIQITNNGGIFAQESLDGKTLYFADDDAVWSLPVADIERGRTDPLKLFEGLVYSTNFGLTSGGIYYMSAGPSPRQSTISFFDFRTKKMRSLLQINKLWWFGLTVSPDQRSLLYSVRDYDGTDLLLVENEN